MFIFAGDHLTFQPTTCFICGDDGWCMVVLLMVDGCSFPVSHVSPDGEPSQNFPESSWGYHCGCSYVAGSWSRWTRLGQTLMPRASKNHFQRRELPLNKDQLGWLTLTHQLQVDDGLGPSPRLLLEVFTPLSKRSFEESVVGFSHQPLGCMWIHVASMFFSCFWDWCWTSFKPSLGLVSHLTFPWELPNKPCRQHGTLHHERGDMLFNQARVIQAWFGPWTSQARCEKRNTKYNTHTPSTGDVHFDGHIQKFILLIQQFNI